MKCFIMGLVGALLLLASAFVVKSQYSDYRATAETIEWLAQIQAVQSAIEEKAFQQKSFAGVGNEIDKELSQVKNIDLYEITESGVIILSGGRDGQIVVLIPYLSEDHVAWRCIGGSTQAVPSRCAVR